MSETKEFIQKIINSFTPNTPLKVKEFVHTDDHYLVFVTLYYGHKVPSWKSEMINYLQQKILEYTQVPTYISVNKKDFSCVNNHLLGVKIIYDKEKRPAFRLFVDSIFHLKSFI